MDPLISVIMPAYNKALYTQRALQALLQSAHDAVEIIVVDNGSTDQTPAVLAEFTSPCQDRGFRCSVLKNKQNTWAPTARNLGIQAARGEFFAFLDNDIIIRSRDWAARLLAELTPGVAIAGPKLVYPVEPYCIECAGVGISRTGGVQYRGRGEDRLDPRFTQSRDVQCLTSAFWLVPRPVLDEIGVFDEAFHPVQFEDFDLCYRARSKGHRVRYVADVEAYHFENVTTGGTTGLNFRYFTIRNGMEFKRRWREMFAQEDGPADEETGWKELPRVRLDEVGPLPLTGPDSDHRTV